MSLDNLIRHIEIRMFDSLFMDFEHFHKKYHYMREDNAKLLYTFYNDNYFLSKVFIY